MNFKEMGAGNFIKTLEMDPFTESVSNNCCLLEIKPIYDSYTGGVDDKGKKDTIFIGTYDGNLYALRMDIKKEENTEAYVLLHLKRWQFSSPITSIIQSDFFNFFQDSSQNKVRD